MVHIDLQDYVSVDGGSIVDDLYDDMMERAVTENKQRKIKNVFKDEE